MPFGIANILSEGPGLVWQGAYACDTDRGDGACVLSSSHWHMPWYFWQGEQHANQTLCAAI